jgi:glutamate decarboxylase
MRMDCMAGKKRPPEDLIFNVNYLGGSMPTFALNFSRPGGQVVAQYYNFVRLGRDGYTKLHSSCYRTAQYLAREITALGPFEMIFGGDPADGIPAVCWKIPEGVNPGYTLYDLADRLRMRGWQVPAYSMPANREDLVVQRILVRTGVSRDLAGILVGDFKSAIDYLTRRPPMESAVPRDGTAFSH